MRSGRWVACGDNQRTKSKGFIGEDFFRSIRRFPRRRGRFVPSFVRSRRLIRSFVRSLAPKRKKNRTDVLWNSARSSLIDPTAGHSRSLPCAGRSTPSTQNQSGRHQYSTLGARSNDARGCSVYRCLCMYVRTARPARPAGRAHATRRRRMVYPNPSERRNGWAGRQANGGTIK